MYDAEDQGRFDRAIALFNDGAFFEAHEDWEDLWHEAVDAHRLWLQGLIQFAAAFVHFARGFHDRGFFTLMRQATEKTHPYTGTTHGMDWPRFSEDLDPWRDHAEAVAAGRARLVEDAPGPPPRIHPLPGHRFQPLPPDPDS